MSPPPAPHPVDESKMEQNLLDSLSKGRSCEKALAMLSGSLLAPCKMACPQRRRLGQHETEDL